MLTNDLFNTDYERRLTEGAVDQLEQRRIDDLAMKMDDLVKRAKEVKDPAHRAALVKEFKKCKAERDSYYHVKEAGIGQDLVNKTEKMARATPQTKAGAVASTVKHAARWLAGKGGPGQEGPTYEGVAEGSEDPADRGEYDREGDMAKDNIHTIVRNARELERILGDNDNLPEWVQDKLANIKGMMTAVSEYMQTQHERDHEAATGREGVTFAETQKKNSEAVDEGWSDAVVSQRTGRPRTAYSVYIKGRKWRDFETDDHAEAVANKLRAKFKQEGRDPSVITIAPTDYDKGMDENDKPADWGKFPPAPKITIDPPRKLKSGETHQGINDYWKAHGQAPIYKTNEAGSPAQQAAIAIAKKKAQGVAEAVSKNDLLKQVGDKLNDPEFRKKTADPNKRWEKGDLYQGPGKDDPSYSKNFGHGYPDVGSNRSHNRDVEKSLKKKGVAEGDDKYAEINAIEENLRDWFGKEKWVRMDTRGNIKGDCARGSSSEGKPKCLPAAKAHALGKKGRASAAQKKRREDPNPERRGKAINVATKTKEDDLDEACWKGYHKAGMKTMFGKRYPNCVKNKNEDVEEALSKNDLLKQVGDKLNDPEFRKKPADPTKRWEKGDLYQGPGPDDYGYTGYQGHGMPTDKAERARIRADKKKGVSKEAVAEAGTRAGAINTVQQLYQAIQNSKGKPQHEIDLLQRQLNALARKYQIRPEEYTASAGQQSQQQAGRQQPPPPPPGGQQAGGAAGSQGQQSNYWDPISNPEWAAKAQAAYRQKNGQPQYDPNWVTKNIQAGHAMGAANQAAMNKSFADMNAAGPWNMPKGPQPGMASVAESLEGYVARGECPACGGVMVAEDQLTEKQDACYHKVKSRYKVWPSAYASGALVQCRKKGAANWGNGGKNESAEQELAEKWTKKYKSSINCSNPKGFSQKAHCAGRNKNEGMFSTLEENNEARDAVESAIIRRIMVAHKDLLMKFGTQKVMDAAQAIADDHSNVEEIGTSDVSAYVHEVERYLAMNN